MTVRTRYERCDITMRDGDCVEMKGSKQGKKRIIYIIVAIAVLMIGVAVWFVFSSTGRRMLVRMFGRYILNEVNYVKVDKDGETIIRNADGTVIARAKEPRTEDYVRTYLIFGIEDYSGGTHTDAMMLVSLNSVDNTIKLTSLLRDTYVDIPGCESNKLNTVFSKGGRGAITTKEAQSDGAALLVRVVEDTYDVDIAGYGFVYFSNFVNIIDCLGGLDIELTEEEAFYLNTDDRTFLSEEDKNLHAGMFHMNGNQVLEYARTRAVATKDGLEDDFGRTARQRQIINEIINNYKSAGISDMIKIMNDCLGYVYTGLTEQEIIEAMELVVGNNMFDNESMQLPIEGLYTDSKLEGIYNGKDNITYALVMDGYLDENIKRFHEFLFLDGENPEE